MFASDLACWNLADIDPVQVRGQIAKAQERNQLHYSVTDRLCHKNAKVLGAWIRKDYFYRF